MSCSICIDFGKWTALNLNGPLVRQRPINCQAAKSLTASSLFEVTTATSWTLSARMQRYSLVARR